MIAIRRALLSVSDKTGIVELARGLADRGIELLSTGGTHRALVGAGMTVAEVADYTGSPEMLDGRVKTLHPKVHGGILFRRDRADDQTACQQHGIEGIDLVVVNLYPFEKTVANPSATSEEAIEQIDIGGPSMIRSAAKNHTFVAVLTDPADYAPFLGHLTDHDGAIEEAYARGLAASAFARTARYDQAIADYMARISTSAPTTGEEPSAFPDTLELRLGKALELRYGENPHQQAALYADPRQSWANVVGAQKRQGKELSYNNLLDLESALSIVRELPMPAAVVIKHTNPCGAAQRDRLADAFDAAYETDPVSAFGSILGFNRPVDEATATAISQPNRFVEAIIAPAFEPAAFHVLTTRPSWRKNVRLLEVGNLARLEHLRSASWQIRSIEGGLLCQSADTGPNGFEDRRTVTRRAPSEREESDLAFAWVIVKHVRSNAIVLVRDGALIGVGAGQMSRVDSVRIAIEKAGERARGAVLGSDAFFPFRDGVDLAAAAGVTAIVQPGRSLRDSDVIAACDEQGVAMFFAGMRHFKH